jgi:hypothetical protein
MMRFFSRALLPAGLLCGLAACGYEYNNDAALKAAYDRLSAAAADTLIVEKADCGACRDVRVLQGAGEQLPAGSRLAIGGAMPLDVLDPADMSFDPDMSFRLVGKLLPAEGAGTPVFYVESFSRFLFHPRYWEEKGPTGSYTRRNKMVQGMSDNLLFQGRPLGELTALLGQPDSVVAGRISYRIDDNRGGETDPAKASKLDIYFRPDSIITEQEIIDPLTNVQ